MILLDGKTVSNNIKSELKDWCSQHMTGQDSIVIFLLTDHPSSTTYVRMKQQFGKDIGITVRIINADNIQSDELIRQIHLHNLDPHCRGIMLQLPLPEQLQQDQATILSSIAPSKDIDGLSGITRGRSMIGKPSIIPATPQGVLTLLDAYDLGMMQGKNVTIIGQSALVGMPLATSCMQRGASVYSFNQRSHPQDIQTSSKKSDYIMSATGVPHLITADHVRTDKSQILIDIGRSMVQGKATGDIDTHGVQELVYALTPVPGGVGPMTIASLFSNMKTLYEQHQQKKLS